MRAVLHDRYGSYQVAELRDIPKPEPQAGEVLVRVRAASLNTADLDHLRGLPRIARLGIGLRHPKVNRVGLDVAGEVEAVGPGVNGLVPGDRVWADLFSYGHGSLADYVCVSETGLRQIPTGLSFEDASTIPHSGLLALQGLVGGSTVVEGDRVLINGAGGCVGPFAIQIAKALGAHVTGVDHTDKLELVRAAGADRVVDYTVEDVTRSPDSYELILDIAATRSFIRFRRILADGGRYLLIARNISGFFSAAVFGGLVSLLGKKRLGTFTWAPNRSEDLERMGGLILSGDLRPIVDRVVPLEGAVEAIGRLEEGLARGKIIVIPGSGTPGA